MRRQAPRLQALTIASTSVLSLDRGVRTRRRTRRSPQPRRGLQGRDQGRLFRRGTGLPLCGTAVKTNMDNLIRTFSERGDLAHLALFLWASSASAAAVYVLRELAAAVRRFDDFVRELARFNKRIGDQE